MRERKILGEEKWKKYLKAGCYQYAIDYFSNEFLKVGDIIGKSCNEYVSDKYLIGILREELRFLRYEPKEIETDTIVSKGDKKIYPQRSEHTGYYHFLKQDINGIWSHKFPGEMPITVDSYGQEIEDPESMIDAPFYGWCFCLKRS